MHATSSSGQTPPRPGRPASLAPSISSVLSDATTVAAPAHEQRGFGSREEYLAALHEFAESKLYMPAGEHTIYGWYGEKTMDDYKNRPRLRDGRYRRKKNQGKDSDDSTTERRRNVAPIPEESATASVSQQEQRAEAETEKSRGLTRLRRLFTVGSK